MAKTGNKHIDTFMEGKASPVVDGVLDKAFFEAFQLEYRRKTGYQLVLSDLDGSINMGLPDCDKFPCMKSCRECREDIFKEAIRTSQVCMDTCHEGYTIWGLPVMFKDSAIGGLVVIGGEHRSDLDKGRFEKACDTLYEMMVSWGLYANPFGSVAIPQGKRHKIVNRELFEEANRSMSEHTQSLLGALKLAEKASAETAFEQIRNTILGAAELPIEVLRGFTGDLIYKAKRQFIQAGLDPYACTAEAGGLVENLSQVADMQELEALLSRIYERLSFLSRQSAKDPDELLMDRIASYIEEHLRDDLNRESVARAVGISPSRFSRLVNEKKGRTFTDLLNQYRIERAALLLVRSSDSLAEIAGETGFCDQSYFSKVFRKYKELSPSAYRDSHRA
jgi:two-component system response regulator YesN